MSFEVEIPDSIERKIDSWEMTESFKLHFYDKLEEIAGNRSSSEVTEFVAPVRGMFTRFTLTDEESGLDHGFFLWMNGHEKEGTRIVIDVKWLV